MKASETKFQQIIEGTKQYVVPLFQRPYSWDKKEWNVLWEDLTWLIENDDPKNHFIGSIVTMPTTSVPEGVAKYLLIDGQQRLTTIFILLTLLRDRASRLNRQDQLASEIEQTMLLNPFKKLDDNYKLLPTQGDRPVFMAMIKGDLSNETGRIIDCYQYFERKINTNGTSISDLYKAVTTRLSVVSIVLDYDDNPHLVFESLNAKGRPLTQSDLIRNYFFMRVHVDHQETVYNNYWHPMQEALEENLTEYIRHYLMKNGSLVKQSDVYFTLKDRVSEQDALAALGEIYRFSKYYQKFIDPQTEEDAVLRNSLQRLKRLEVTTVYPFLLNAYENYESQRISRDELVEIIHVIENFVIRRFICNIPSSQLNKIFPLLYQQALLQNPSSLVQGVKSILQTKGYPKDQEFRERLIDGRLYGAGDRLTKTRIILETLELGHNHKEAISFSNLTIEHVLPQSITEWWQSHLGGDWQIDHELCLNILGNLTLTAYNSELSNQSYPRKRAYFETSHLELNKYFLTTDTWDRSAIERRSEILAGETINLWPYFGENNNYTVADLNSVTGQTPRYLQMLGQKFEVQSWRDVFERTLNTMAALEPDSFDSLVVDYPRFISKDPASFRRTRKLENDYYIEVNLSSKDVYRFCTQIIESVGLSSEDWVVETV
ncbi:MAG: DUF262 domain-containing protein [Anaerolineae bacterium]|nr:DUF262 domain-containing protein [Anaerolineae bacterium]